MIPVLLCNWHVLVAQSLLLMTEAVLWLDTTLSGYA
jgi:hypothetical protein